MAERGTTATANQARLDRRRSYSGPLILREGFRPLFLAAGFWAACAAPLWVAVWTGLLGYRGLLDPPLWHVHEMIFGFVGAAIGGFLLTAVPNWTGRLPVRGAPLAGLVLLWCAGRVAMWVSADLGAELSLVLDVAYLAALGGCIANEIFAGRNWRNLPVLGVLVALVAANVLFHLPALGLAETGELAVRLAVMAVILLITLIGGRIVPSFTRNWFAKNDGPEIASPMRPFDLATIAVTLAAALLWAALPGGPVAGGALAAAGVLNLARLARWKGWRTCAEPLVAVLHLGYFWLGAGLVLLGAALLGLPVSRTAGLHVLTMGAMGTMVLAVMTRAILGHTGRGLHAGPGTVAIYGLVTAAIAGRVVFEAAPSAGLLWLAAGAWSTAFLAFVWFYAPLAAKRKTG